MKLELHAHTDESSGCGKMPAEELIGRFKGAGYETIVITDHLVGGLYAGEPLETRVEKWMRGYRNAKKAGDRIGLNVLLGAEVRFAAKHEDILIYGVKEEDVPWLFELMDTDRDQKALYEAAHAHGLLVVQAHPFRKGLERQDYRYLDGSEVYNGNPRHDNKHELAHEFGEKGGAGFIKTSGSDAHRATDVARGGVITPCDIRTNEELLDFLKNTPDMERIETA